MENTGTRRDWEVRNQGRQPLNDPESNKSAGEADIAAPTEGVHRSGDVSGDAGASGTTNDGAREGSGSRGGTASPTGAGAAKN